MHIMRFRCIGDFFYARFVARCQLFMCMALPVNRARTIGAVQLKYLHIIHAVYSHSVASDRISGGARKSVASPLRHRLCTAAAAGGVDAVADEDDDDDVADGWLHFNYPESNTLAGPPGCGSGFTQPRNTLDCAYFVNYLMYLPGV